MKTNKTLTVLFHGCTVGTLAVNGHGKVAFSYDEDWMETGKIREKKNSLQ